MTTNEIKWNNWDKKIFDKAKNENKLILLDISAVWCHWCHVMDDTTYSNLNVIKLINENLIPVKVDVDERPDIRERYAMGGFPTTALLDYTGKVIAGGTYIPPADMVNFVNNVLEQKTSGQLSKNTNAKTYVEESKSHDKKLNIAIKDEVLGYILAYFDETFGGFYGQQKFPHGDSLKLAIDSITEDNKNSKILKTFVEKTLEGMAEGLYDPIEGGFFRYSTTREWKKPHFEKMLETNAEVIRAYLFGYSLTGNKKYREISEHSLKYVESTLLGDAFYGSQDADEEYYQKSKEERKKLNPPFVDKRIYVDYNALMCRTFLTAYSVLGEKKYLERAEYVMKFILKNCYSKSDGMCHILDKKKKIFGLLSDNMKTSSVLLDLYQGTSNRDYLDKSHNLMEFILTNFTNKNGELRDRISDAEDIGKLNDPNIPLFDNVEAVKTLNSLYYLGFGKETYKSIAKTILEMFVPTTTKYGYFGSSLASAVNTFLREPIEITIINDTNGLLLREALKFTHDRRLIESLNPKNKDDSKRIKERGYPSDKAVFICSNHTCSRPFNTPDQIKDHLGQVVKK